MSKLAWFLSRDRDHQCLKSKVWIFAIFLEALPSILNKHKKWLEEFKERQHKVKEQIEEKTKQ